MIYFYSGTPGSGKSLHCAKMIDSWVKKGRNIIANFDINNEFWKTKRLKKKGQILCVDNSCLTVDGLIDFADNYHQRNTKGQIIEKQTLLIIDECQTMFNSRSWNAKGRSKWVIFFTQHRKYGFEVILISQNKDLVDKQIRGCFEYNYVHRNVKNFKVFGRILSLFFGGNFFVVVVTWMMNGKKDHCEFLLNMKRYYSLYDSYRIFDTENLRRLSPGAVQDGDARGPNAEAPEKTGALT
ncbi:zonular occludens toxin domain-containing protein [Lactonifactor longoviformis]|uniref:zonular occludens toxin domain-containing protein n=1 Tax=Lactonifactor longoviformis TaxID=341220 RepID=UPI001D0149DD|nr:zonular occludens toxin domain-containing protein [Lactonifactor longoviformis]MCB5712132.1 zonular occludens toxin domain-containing protein [Lactonifactor longoviformis]MCB5716176.1 zonular occludens toxin domain-containing protein [Lactonifactor longoviformis]